MVAGAASAKQIPIHETRCHSVKSEFALFRHGRQTCPGLLRESNGKKLGARKLAALEQPPDTAALGEIFLSLIFLSIKPCGGEI